LKETSRADGALKTEQANLVSQNKNMAENEAWLSSNKTKIEKKYPKLFGILDAIMGRHGLVNTASDLIK